MRRMKRNEGRGRRGRRRMKQEGEERMKRRSQ